jgi:mono/diheme cytochrome c family protein
MMRSTLLALPLALFLPVAAEQAVAQENPSALKVTGLEYEGWRQYGVQCARCHGQDVVGNPVASHLLQSLAAGGPIDTEEKFTAVVRDGRVNRGMPGFKEIMTADQIKAVYAYVKGRADKRIPAGRPAKPPD